MATKVEYVIESSGKNFFEWKDLWRYRELFYFFTWRDVKVKYKQTAIGILWVVLQPVATVMIFSLFFGRALKIPSGNLPYPVFVFSGLLLWVLFSASVNNAGNSMLTNAAIIKKIYFPRIIIPVSSVLVSGIDFLIGFVVFIGVLFYYDIHVNISAVLIFWPASILLAFIGTLGISCLLAALNVKYRDFRYVIPFVLQIALFVSPVIYPITIIENKWLNYLLAANPMYGAIVLFRVPLQETLIDWNLTAISMLSTLIFFVWGLVYFKKTEAYFADIA